MIKPTNIAPPTTNNRRLQPFQKIIDLSKLIIAIGVMLVPFLPCRAQCDSPLNEKDQTIFNSAVSIFEAKHFSEANTHFKKLAARNPQSADIQFYLGMIAAYKADNPGAIRRYFTKVINLCPEYNNALAHYYMAIIHYTDEKYEEAVKELNTYFALTNDSHNPDYESVYSEASNYLYWSQFLADAELNKVPFSPQPIHGISSKSDELLPYITWDKTQAYYLRLVSEKNTKTYYSRELDRKYPKMMLSTLNKGNYSTGEPLPEPFNLHDNEGGVTLTADNQHLYYSIVTVVNGYNNCDIYYSQLQGGVWSKIKNAGKQINSPKHWDSQPSITPDGKYLYFASNRPGGVGGIDIWRCRRLPNGDWSRAENLGSRINTPRNEKCPFIHADGHTLYFASNGWQGFGGYDMYFININDNSIARPTNLGLPINTENDDIYFGVTLDGSIGYFAGKSPDYTGIGGQDVYQFELYPAAQPEPMQLCSITTTDSTQRPLSTTITLKHYGSEDAEYLAPNGKATVALSCQEENLLIIQSEGYMPIIQTYSPHTVKNTLSNPQHFTLQPIILNHSYPLQGIIYNVQQQQLSSSSKKILDEYVHFLHNHPMMHLCICSPHPNESQAIYNYLLHKKLRRERLSIAYGEQLTFKVKQL